MRISALQPSTRESLASLRGYFMDYCVADTASAAHRAVIAVGRIVHAKATLMGYADSFVLIGAVLVCAALSVGVLESGAAAGTGGGH